MEAIIVATVATQELTKVKAPLHIIVGIVARIQYCPIPLEKLIWSYSLLAEYYEIQNISGTICPTCYQDFEEGTECFVGMDECICEKKICDQCAKYYHWGNGGMKFYCSEKCHFDGEERLPDENDKYTQKVKLRLMDAY